MRKKKLLDKKSEIKRTYDKLIEAVNTLLNEPDEAPELVKSMLVNPASIKSAQDNSNSTNGVPMGVELTATVVHPDTVVKLPPPRLLLTI